MVLSAATAESAAESLPGMPFSVTPGSSVIVVIQFSDTDVAFNEI
jgi:hypothetical protein